MTQEQYQIAMMGVAMGGMVAAMGPAMEQMAKDAGKIQHAQQNHAAVAPAGVTPPAASPATAPASAPAAATMGAAPAK